MKICDACRKKLSKKSLDAIESVTSELNQPTPTSSQANPLFCHGSETVSSFNVCLGEISKTPFSKNRAKTVDRKYKRLLKFYHRGTY